MTVDLQALKAAVPFPELAAETHDLDRTGKVPCPAHADNHPSCHVYDNGAYCYACGWRGDHVDWLMQVHGLNFIEATEALRKRAGGHAPPVSERLVKPHRPAPIFRPVDENILEAHRRRAAQLDRIPAAMQRRGFTLADLQHLGFAAYGQDAVFPVTGPDGAVLALKRRYARPGSGPRYRYTTPGHGTPAWCSPDFDKDKVLIVEGELNGMICWLACPELAVMGTAGTGSALHLEALRGRTAYIYADGDDPGQKARDKWAAQALSAGARKVFVLDPWPADACDLAGRAEREKLSELLSKSCRSFDAVKPFSASNTASKGLRLAQEKPDLMFSCSRFSSGPKLGDKPCL